MNKKNFTLIVPLILLIVLGVILYNEFDSKNSITNTDSFVPTVTNKLQVEIENSTESAISTPEDPKTDKKLFDKEYADVKYIKEEVQQVGLIDKVIFPDIMECPIYIVEPIDIDSDFLLDLAYHGDMSDVTTHLKETDIVEISKRSKYGGNYTGRADYAGSLVNLAYNKKDGSISIFYNIILKGENSEAIIEDDINSLIKYSIDFMKNFDFAYDQNSVWIGEKNKNQYEIRKLTFEYQLNGINFYPGDLKFYKYNNVHSVGPSIEIKINTSGIGGYSANNLCKIKDVIDTNVELITFKKAYEIFKNNSTKEFSYAKFYYCLDVVDEDHFYEISVDGDTFNVYQSFKYKTLPVWIFFKGGKYDREYMDFFSDNRMIIDAQTGEIIDN